VFITVSRNLTTTLVRKDASDDLNCQYGCVGATNPKAPVRSYGGVGAAERIAIRRERLLDAALELYGTRGFIATGVKDVCRQAGLTDRYFYESFRDAGELFTASYDRTTGELLALVAESVAAVPQEPEAQVRAAIRAFVCALADDPRKARVLFVEAASAGADAERHVRASLGRFAQLVAATAGPHLPPGIPERLIQMGAFSLVGAIERVIIEWQEGRLEVTIDEMIEHLVRLFLAAGASAGVAPARSRARRRRDGD
jgi:AcrR family transcriptional regulator